MEIKVVGVLLSFVLQPLVAAEKSTDKRINPYGDFDKAVERLQSKSIITLLESANTEAQDILNSLSKASQPRKPVLDSFDDSASKPKDYAPGVMRQFSERLSEALMDKLITTWKKEHAPTELDGHFNRVLKVNLTDKKVVAELMLAIRIAQKIEQDNSSDDPGDSIEERSAKIRLMTYLNMLEDIAIRSGIDEQLVRPSKDQKGTGNKGVSAPLGNHK